MKTLIAVLAVAAVLLLAGPRAGAQTIYTAVPGGTTAYTASPRVSYHYYPYSYWAAYPQPARQYNGFGTNDFPYYGRPYGSPSDPWTWPAMSAAYQHDLFVRYYYAPVR